MVEKDFGHLFISSSTSHFFDKTDFGQYLFKFFCLQNVYTNFIQTQAYHRRRSGAELLVVGDHGGLGAEPLSARQFL